MIVSCQIIKLCLLSRNSLNELSHIGKVSDGAKLQLEVTVE